MTPSVEPPSPSATWPAAPEYPSRRCAAGRRATDFRGPTARPGATAATPVRRARPSSTCWRAARGGLSLAAAVQRVAERPAGPVGLGLRRAAAPPPRARRRRCCRDARCVALSHAIEDECCARAAEPVLFGGFQRESVPARRRTTAGASWPARRGPPSSSPTSPRPGPAGARGPGRGGACRREAPLNREWLVVCDAPDLPACLAAVERPGQGAAVRERTLRGASGRSTPWSSATPAGSPRALADRYRPGWRARAAVAARRGPAGVRRRTCTGPRSSSTGWSATSTRPADGVVTSHGT